MKIIVTTGILACLLAAAGPAAGGAAPEQDESGTVHITDEPVGSLDLKQPKRRLFLQKTRETSDAPHDPKGGSGGVYSYQDANGVIHITDEPANVPGSRREPEPSTTQNQTGPSGIPRSADDARISSGAGSAAGADKCTVQLKQRLEDCGYHFKASRLPDGKRKTQSARDVFTIHKMCGDLLLRPRFSAAEQRWIKSLSEQAVQASRELTAAERYEIEALIKAFYGPCGVTREPEPPRLDQAQLDVHLKELFRAMADALGRDDLDKACSYFLEPYQEMRKKQYAAFSPDVRRKMAQDLLASQLAVERVEDGRATYHLIAVREGKKYSFQLVFMRNIHGTWKIYNF